MRILKMMFRLAFVVSIAVAIITHNSVVAIVSLGLASFNLGILVGERSGK